MLLQDSNNPHLNPNSSPRRPAIRYSNSLKKKIGT
jgi:hypothetical protein